MFHNLLYFSLFNQFNLLILAANIYFLILKVSIRILYLAGGLVCFDALHIYAQYLAGGYFVLLV